MTVTEQTGLSIEINPSLFARDFSRTYDNVSNGIVGYEHEISAHGGYLSARIDLTVDQLTFTDWLNNGLGRDAVIKNSAGQIVFRGFIDTVSGQVGGVQVTIGPLMDIGNRISVAYTPIDYNVYPAATGAETVTPIAEDLASQARYGIIEKTLSAGQVTQVQAERVRAVALSEMALPKRSAPDTSISPGDGQTRIPVTLNVLGYINVLKWYIYNNGSPGVTTLSQKLLSIISGDPNGIISTSLAFLDSNALAVPTSTEMNRFAFDQIEELMTFGNDTTDDRRNYGIYGDLKFVFETPDKVIKYYYYLSDQGQRLIATGGRAIRPWDIKPGCYIFVGDYALASEPPATSVATINDPRVIFIETVRYTAPYTISLSGAKSERLSIALAKLSMGGY